MVDTIRHIDQRLDFIDASMVHSATWARCHRTCLDFSTPLAVYQKDVLVNDLDGTVPCRVWGGNFGHVAGRNGRKVKIKVGEIEAEANSVKELDEVLERVGKVKRHNKPRE